MKIVKLTDVHDAKILVVEDQQNTRRIIGTLYLFDYGFRRVETAADGEQAWEMLSAAAALPEPFNLVISDWMMPRLDGVGLYKRMRADPRLADLPFIMLTAHSEKGDVLEARKAGIKYYVTKPFPPDVLAAKVEEALKV